MNLYLIIGIIVSILGLMIVVLARKAPEGYEDESGFHPGSPGKTS